MKKVENYGRISYPAPHGAVLPEQEEHPFRVLLNGNTLLSRGRNRDASGRYCSCVELFPNGERLGFRYRGRRMFVFK